MQVETSRGNSQSLNPEGVDLNVLILGDTHLPWIDWKVAEGAARFASDYKPDLIVQVGDLIDGYNWSRFSRDPDAPSAGREWADTLKAVKRFHGLFDPKTMMYIIEGNHDRRYQMRAFEANIPSQLIRPLREVFPYPNWKWWVDQKHLKIDGVTYMHGDEGVGTAGAKSRQQGRNVVHGHTHKGSIDWTATSDSLIFGMEVGTLMDPASMAAKYAKKALLKNFMGWATVSDGIPVLYPYKLMRRRSSGYKIAA